MQKQEKEKKKETRCAKCGKKIDEGMILCDDCFEGN